MALVLRAKRCICKCIQRDPCGVMEENVVVGAAGMGWGLSGQMGSFIPEAISEKLWVTEVDQKGQDIQDAVLCRNP